VSEVLQFDSFLFRPTDDADHETARAWNDQDEWHRGKIAPEHWTEKSKGVDTYMLKDEHGDLMLVRMERLTRVSIQFPPASDRATRDRIRNGLKKGLDFVSAAVGLKGFGEILFDTDSPLLRRFAIDTLRFTPKPNVMFRRVRIWSPEDEPIKLKATDGPKLATASGKAVLPAEQQGDK
jgi:hypothetical protein